MYVCQILHKLNIWSLFLFNRTAVVHDGNSNFFLPVYVINNIIKYKNN